MKPLIISSLLVLCSHWVAAQSYLITPDSVLFKRNTHSSLNSLHLKNGNINSKRFPFTSIFTESDGMNLIQINSESHTAGVVFKNSYGSLDTLGSYIGRYITNDFVISNQFYISKFSNATSIHMYPDILINGEHHVGMGTNMPKRKLHIYEGNSGVTPHINTKLFVESDTSTYINIGVPNDSESGVLFGRVGSGANGGFIYDANSYLKFRTSASTRMTISDGGNVGIATTTPDAKLDINGDVVLSKKLALNTNAVHNALDRQGASRIVVEDVNVTINGIAGGVDGMILYIVGSRSSVITINNHNSGALGINQIATNTGVPIVITAYGGVTLMYTVSNGISNWRVIGYAE